MTTGIGTDRVLRQALGDARLPGTVWTGLIARLAEVDAAENAAASGQVDARRRTSGRRSWLAPKGDAVPALAAAASFCILLQLYLAGGPGLAWSRIEGLFGHAVLLAQRWALLASTLVTGGR